MTTTLMIKAILLSGALFPSTLTTAARCDFGLNEVSVTCVAADGITEEQFPKEFGAAPRTDCNAIPTPATDPNFPNPHWRECLRTVEFGFHWMFTGKLPEIGQPDPKLVSIRRRIENSRHAYPEEQVALVESYWGRDIWKGWSLRDTTKQIVVDLCKEPITYVYSLDVTIQKSDGTVCTDTASYVYEILSNEAEVSGYTQYKPRPYPSAEVNRAPPATTDGGPVDAVRNPATPVPDCSFCRSSVGIKATNRCQRKVRQCIQRPTKVRCINNKLRRYDSCCTMQGGKSCY